MKFHHLILGAVLTAVFPGVAAAEDTATVTNGRLGAAWDALNKEEGHFLTPQQFASLNSLAFQAAVVKICEGQKLDQDAFGRKIEALITGADKELQPAQAEQRKAAVLVAFGARFGIFLAEGSANKASVCSSAAEIKATKDISVLAK